MIQLDPIPTESIIGIMQLGRPWVRRAACLREGSFVFEGTKGKAVKKEILAAIDICRTKCPVRSECEEWANKQPAWSHVVIAGNFYENNKIKDIKNDIPNPQE